MSLLQETVGLPRSVRGLNTLAGLPENIPKFTARRQQGECSVLFSKSTIRALSTNLKLKVNRAVGSWARAPTCPNA